MRAGGLGDLLGGLLGGGAASGDMSAILGSLLGGAGGQGGGLDIGGLLGSLMGGAEGQEGAPDISGLLQGLMGGAGGQEGAPDMAGLMGLLGGAGGQEGAPDMAGLMGLLGGAGGQEGAPDVSSLARRPDGWRCFRPGRWPGPGQPPRGPSGRQRAIGDSGAPVETRGIRTSVPGCPSFFVYSASARISRSSSGVRTMGLALVLEAMAVFSTRAGKSAVVTPYAARDGTFSAAASDVTQAMPSSARAAVLPGQDPRDLIVRAPGPRCRAAGRAARAR